MTEKRMAAILGRYRRRRRFLEAGRSQPPVALSYYLYDEDSFHEPDNLEVDGDAWKCAGCLPYSASLQNVFVLGLLLQAFYSPEQSTRKRTGSTAHCQTAATQPNPQQTRW